jgi:hypothetical protein
MTIAEAYANIGKRVYITIDVPDTKWGLTPLYAGDTGVIETGAGEIGFTPDRYLPRWKILKYAHKGVPFVEYCVLANKQAGETLPQQLELFGDMA